MNRILSVVGAVVLATPAIAADSKPLTAKIDQRIEAVLKANGVTPAPLADDAEFIRRVYLDLAGRIPAVSEVRDFLADKSPDKRARVIDKLLDGPGYQRHFASLWRREWLPQTVSNPQFQFIGASSNRGSATDFAPMRLRQDRARNVDGISVGTGGRPVVRPQLVRLDRVSPGQ